MNGCDMIEQETLDVMSESIEQADIEKVKQLLQSHPELANADLRPAEKRDHFTNGRPLYRAAQKLNRGIIELLLDHGADPNAAGNNPDDQPEFGLPLYLAIANEDHALAHLLMDRGASPDAYPNCDKAAIEICFYKARSEGLNDSLVRRAYSKYLPDAEQLNLQSVCEMVGDNAGENMKAFARLVDLGGQPPFAAIVREGFDDLAMEIVQHSPNEAGTPHDHPNSTVLNNIFGPARWYGYPKLFRRVMDHIGDDYKYESALQTIDVAIASHNRDGGYQEYREIIVMQLEFLKSSGQIEKAIAEPEFKPLHKIATDFTWHANYGYRAEIAKPECFVDLAELFVSWGFRDVNYRHPKSGLSPLSAAVKRGHHPGIAIYVQWLIDNGAEIGHAVSIAQENGNDELLRILQTGG